jgi:plasmid stabilization system protein ParE
MAADRAAVVLSQRAAGEVQAAVAWYDAQGLGLGNEFLHAVDGAVTQISQRPHSFPTITADVHRALVRRFPYGIFFAIEPTSVVILAILHTHRHPRRWPSRPAR